MQPTELANTSVASVLRSAWRVAALYLQQSFRLYVGPAQWKRFPDSIVFTALSVALTILSYTGQLLLNGYPLSVYWVNILILAGAGAIMLIVKHDTPFANAFFGVLLVSVLLQLVLSTLARRRAPDPPVDDGPPHRALTMGAGVAAGFTTMAANAAGPVMAVYLQLAKVEKKS